MSKTKKMTDLTNVLDAAYQEYETAYREYEAATKMNVLTPESVGTFGGAWDCDQARLLRSLVLAIRRTAGVCSTAAEKAANGEEIVMAEGGYDTVPGEGADVYRMPNGLYRDPDGRYLTEVEADIVTRSIRGRSVTTRTVTDEEWDRTHAHSYTPGKKLTQKWIEEQAKDQIARTLTKSHITGWPVCTDSQKIDACRRVRDIYRTLIEAYRDAE